VYGAIVELDGHHAGEVVDLGHAHAGARAQSALGEVLQQLGRPVGDARDAGGRAGVAVGEGHRRDVDDGAVAGRDRVAVRIVRRLAELRGDSFLEPLGDVVLEALGLGVHLLPRDAEMLDEEELEQPVMAQHLERGGGAARRQNDAVVRLVLDQPEAVELLDHPRHRRRGDVQPVGERLRRHGPAGRRADLLDGLQVVLHGGRDLAHCAEG
jgi:hypothetical protein